MGFALKPSSFGSGTGATMGAPSLDETAGRDLAALLARLDELVQEVRKIRESVQREIADPRVEPGPTISSWLANLANQGVPIVLGTAFGVVLRGQISSTSAPDDGFIVLVDVQILFGDHPAKLPPPTGSVILATKHVTWFYEA